MRRLALLALSVAAFSGCGAPSTDSDLPGHRAERRVGEKSPPATQSADPADLDITARIREELVASDMSVKAQNVSVATRDGKVALSGPVESTSERSRIEEIATEVAGAGNVANALEIAPSKTQASGDTVFRFRL